MHKAKNNTRREGQQSKARPTLLQKRLRVTDQSQGCRPSSSQLKRREKKQSKSSMNVPAGLARKLSPLPPLLYLSGAPKIEFLPFFCLKRRFGEVCLRKMGPQTCDGIVGNGLGVVRPATEAYAEEAIQALRAGKVIAVPTDTLYGFACDACTMEAVNRIYEIKGRKHTSPLAVCVGDVSEIGRFAVTDQLPHGLLDSLLPGPVTVVLRRGDSSELEKSLNPGLESIGIRVPDCNFMRVIARGLGRAMALTSANLSGQPSSVCIKDFENLWEHCAYVYDGSVLPSGRAGSTVVDLTSLGKYKILRPGSAKEMTMTILEKHSLVEEAAVMQ